MADVTETFEEWLSRLDALAVYAGVAKEGGRRLSEMTGPECWREAYEDGLSPSAALAEDASYG